MVSVGRDALFAKKLWWTPSLLVVVDVSDHRRQARRRHMLAEHSGVAPTVSSLYFLLHCIILTRLIPSSKSPQDGTATTALTSTTVQASSPRESTPSSSLLADGGFLPSSSQRLSPATSGSCKATTRLPDAFASLNGRNRTLSSTSVARGSSFAKEGGGGGVDGNMEGSSFGIGELFYLL